MSHWTAVSMTEVASSPSVTSPDGIDFLINNAPGATAVAK